MANWTLRAERVSETALDRRGQRLEAGNVFGCSVDAGVLLIRVEMHSYVRSWPMRFVVSVGTSCAAVGV